MKNPGRLAEKALFSARWLQAPLYVGLIVVQSLYAVLFVNEVVHLCAQAFQGHLEERMILLGALSLVDMVMVANLIFMVILGGWETFVSRIDTENHPDAPEWLSHSNAETLKYKLSASLVTISGVHLLKGFLDIKNIPIQQLWGQIAVHITFVATTAVLFLFSKYGSKANH